MHFVKYNNKIIEKETNLIFDNKYYQHINICDIYRMSKKKFGDHRYI